MVFEFTELGGKAHNAAFSLVNFKAVIRTNQILASWPPNSVLCMSYKFDVMWQYQLLFMPTVHHILYVAVL